MRTFNGDGTVAACSMLEDPAARVRGAACAALGEMGAAGEAHAGAVAAALLEDKDGKVREAACFALGAAAGAGGGARVRRIVRRRRALRLAGPCCCFWLESD